MNNIPIFSQAGIDPSQSFSRGDHLNISVDKAFSNGEHDSKSFSKVMNKFDNKKRPSIDERSTRIEKKSKKEISHHEETEGIQNDSENDEIQVERSQDSPTTENGSRDQSDVKAPTQIQGNFELIEVNEEINSSVTEIETEEDLPVLLNVVSITKGISSLQENASQNKVNMEKLGEAHLISENHSIGQSLELSNTEMTSIGDSAETLEPQTIEKTIDGQKNLTEISSEKGISKPIINLNPSSGSNADDLAKALPSDQQIEGIVEKGAIQAKTMKDNNDLSDQQREPETKNQEIINKVTKTLSGFQGIDMKAEEGLKPVFPMAEKMRGLGLGQIRSTSPKIESIVFPPGIQAIADPMPQKGGVGFRGALSTGLSQVNEGAVLNQVNLQLRSWQPGQDEPIRLLLEPKHLGQLQIDIRLQEKGVSAHILATDHFVKELLEGNQGFLQDALKEQGLHIEQFSVDLGERKGPFFSEGDPGLSSKRQFSAIEEPKVIQAAQAISSVSNRGQSGVSLYI